MKTDTIICSRLADPLHRRKDPELQLEPISSMSCWGDSVWLFDYSTPGSKQSAARINWAFALPDGSRLTDHQHGKLLDALKRFAWSLMTVPGDNCAALAATSMGTLHSGIGTLVCWMNANGYSRFDQLDMQALDRFKEDLSVSLSRTGEPAISENAGEFADEHDSAIAGTEGELGVSSAFNRLRIPCLLWRQRKALAEADISTISQNPWNASELAVAIANKVELQIMPVPAEVAIPILNSAYRMLGRPSDDVIRVTREYFGAWDRGGPGGYGRDPGKSRFVRYKSAIRQVAKFKFSTLPGEKLPWRSAIGSAPLSTLNFKEHKTTVGQEIRILIADIRNACTIVIQGTTGMRASEISSISAGLDAQTGLPSCVKIRPAISGLYEIFSVDSMLTKTEMSPRAEEWIVGMRLTGTEIIPPAVRAIQVLNSLLEPFRQVLDDSAPLLVWFQSGWGLSRSPSNIGPILNATLTDGLKDFVIRNVDLSALPDTSARGITTNDLIYYREKKGSFIRPHQWRKTLAHFVFNTDNHLLPALSMQFKHISLAMTADNYLGRNQAIFQGLDSARAQETATLLYEAATGKTLMAGRMGQRLKEHIAPIRDSIEGLSPSDGWQKTLSLVMDKGIRLWFAEHGKCLPLSPSKMRCHTSAGTEHWLNRQPNYSLREPSICAGCACFIIDERHADFWKARYITNWRAWKEAERSGQEGQFRVILERAKQSRALLIHLAVDTDALEKQTPSHVAADA